MTGWAGLRVGGWSWLVSFSEPRDLNHSWTIDPWTSNFLWAPEDASCYFEVVVLYDWGMILLPLLSHPCKSSCASALGCNKQLLDQSSLQHVAQEKNKGLYNMSLCLTPSLIPCLGYDVPSCKTMLGRGLCSTPSLDPTVHGCANALQWSRTRLACAVDEVTPSPVSDP